MFKIGQVIECVEDFTMFSNGGKTLRVKKGDKGIVNSKGGIYYISGEAKGSYELANLEVSDEYDTKNIAKLIVNKLEEYYILDHLEDYDIPMDDIVDAIEYVLWDVL